MDGSQELPGVQALSQWAKTIKDARKRAFLEALSKHGIVTEACEIAGVSRSPTYAWKDQDPEFSKAWDEAVEMAADKLEEHIHKRITDAKNPSDVLAMFRMKAMRPEKYRENYSFSGDLNVTGGLTLSAAIDEQITSKAEELADAKRRLEAERQLPGPEFTEETPI